MTREEQILKKADKESEIFYKVNDNYGDCFHGGFIDGARWADMTMIKRACDWLRKHSSAGDGVATIQFNSLEEMIESLKNYMEQ